jgi:hypothetical protein
MVVTRLRGRTTLTVHGPETKATLADCPAEGEWFGVRFKVGTFMPLMRCGDLCDRNDVTLPNATGRSFWLHGSAWDFPSFENAETFVKRLAQRGLIVTDRTVEGAIRGELQDITTRTEQRRVLRVTGLTRGAICQIERARRAARLLQGGHADSRCGFRNGLLRPASSHSLAATIYRAEPRPASRVGESSCRFLYNS